MLVTGTRAADVDDQLAGSWRRGWLVGRGLGVGG